ncbi:fimbrial biogenesis chaperone [Pseudoalteromonas aurantia]|uniref:Molecular chaperone n=1 Tax=Pseudoalteromonas aurantia 208 TaxID=1314867 RepID=A0ABR9ECT8_9GAMM|nr:hypothetical protein [Pseudoalteromonas aurantia]MBE0368045.1 hypothetical protein [Pseudoalteromonas aurantia 208]
MTCKKHIALLLVLSLVFSSKVFANLALSEYRLYFDNRTKNNSLMIRNTSGKTLDFRLVLTHKDMTEDGALIDVPLSEVTGRSAKGMLRFSPRRGQIAAKEVQAIRMTVRKKADLAHGEYRAVLRIIASESQDPNASGISIKPKVAYSVPVIVRHGQLEVSSQLINPQLVTQNGRSNVLVWQTLQGNRSLYGDFKILDSDKQIVGEIRNVGVYTPLNRRKVFIPLQTSVQGPVTIQYIENNKYGGSIELEVPMQL